MSNHLHQISRATRRYLQGVVSAACLSLSFFTAQAYELPAGSKSESFVNVEVTDISQQDDNINASLLLDFSHISLAGNTEMVYTPIFVNGTDTLRFQSITVAGRNRWYWLQRNDMVPPILVKGYGKDRGALFEQSSFSSDNASLTPSSDNPYTYSMQLSAPFSEWMEAATFSIDSEIYGCANCLKISMGGGQ